MGENMPSQQTPWWGLPSPQSSSQFILPPARSCPASYWSIDFHVVYIWWCNGSPETKRKKFLVGRFCWFPWCKYSHQVIFKLLMWCYSTPHWDEKIWQLVQLVPSIPLVPHTSLVLTLHYDIEFDYFPGFSRIFIADPTFSPSFAA